MKYILFVNGVYYEDFRTLKEIDNYIYEYHLENEYIQVKRINERK